MFPRLQHVIIHATRDNLLVQFRVKVAFARFADAVSFPRCMKEKEQ